MHVSHVLIGEPDECWPWQGALHKGYGIGHDGVKCRRAHRMVYEVVKGPIPAGLTIDHLCGNKACCNPAHLEAVTVGENVRRANVGGKHSEAHKVRISVALRKRGYKHPPEVRERIATIQRERWDKWRKTHTPKRDRGEAYRAKRRVHVGEAR